MGRLKQALQEFVVFLNRMKLNPTLCRLPLRRSFLLRLLGASAALLVFFSSGSSCRYSGRSGKNRDASWAVKVNGTGLSNGYRVNDSLFRSEQPGETDMQQVQSLGIKSILNLREDRDDSILPGMQQLNRYRVKMVTSRFTDKEIIEALGIIKNAPKPLLVHCKHGADRTGVVMAMYRVVFEQWTKEKAIAELKKGGYGFHTRYDNIPEYILNADTAMIRKQVFY